MQCAQPDSIKQKDRAADDRAEQAAERRGERFEDGNERVDHVVFSVDVG